MATSSGTKYVKPRRSLSGREIEILQLVADGYTNKQIGQSLRISPLTVKSHLSRISIIMGTGDRTQMVVFLLRRKLLKYPTTQISAVVPNARQRKILACLADGMTNATIARQLDLSENTVKTHLRLIAGRLGLPGHWDRVLFAGIALREGWIA